MLGDGMRNCDGCGKETDFLVCADCRAIEIKKSITEAVQKIGVLTLVDKTQHRLNAQERAIGAKSLSPKYLHSRLFRKFFRSHKQ